MITSLAQYITGILYKNNIIDSKMLDIYIYGFEVIVSGFVSIFIGLALGFIFAQIPESIVFLIVFILIRKYCGGYHADTYFRCNSIFMINIAIVMIILKINFNYSIYLHFIIGLICIITYITLAPIENKYKPLTYEEKKKYRITAIIISLIFFCISSVVYFNFLKFSIVIDMALMSVAISMIIERLRKGRDKSEECQANSSQSAC